MSWEQISPRELFEKSHYLYEQLVSRNTLGPMKTPCLFA